MSKGKDFIKTLVSNDTSTSGKAFIKSAIDGGEFYTPSIDEYKTHSGEVKKNLASVLADSKSGKTEFDSDKVRTLVEDYASTQLHIFDDNLKKGDTGIVPIGDNLSNLFKAHGYDFKELYPDLYETFSLQNIEGYAYGNSNAFKEKYDKRANYEMEKGALLDKAVATNEQRGHERNAEKIAAEDKEKAVAYNEELQRLYNEVDWNALTPEERSAAFNNIKYTAMKNTGYYNNPVGFNMTPEEAAERNAAQQANQRGIYADEALYAIRTMREVMSQPDFEEYANKKLDRTKEQQTGSFVLDLFGRREDDASASENFDEELSVNKGGLSEDVAKVYRYLYNTEGEETADNFLSGIKNTVNEGKASYISKVLQEMEKGNPLEKVASGIGQAGYAFASGGEGIGQAFKGIGDTFTGNTEYFMPGTAQRITAKNKADTGGVGRVTLGAVEGLPQVLGTAALGSINPLLGTAFLGTTAYGSSYVDAVNSGASRPRAIGIGLASAGLEIALEYAVGNTIEGFGTSLSSKVGKGVASTKLGGKVANVFNKFATSHPKGATAVSAFGKWLGNAGSEFAEEYLAETAAPMLRNLFIGENNEFTLMSNEQIEAGIIGFITGGILDGVRTSGSISNIMKGGTALRVEQLKMMPDSKILDEYMSRISDADIALALAKEDSSFNNLDGQGMMEAIDAMREQIRSEIKPDEARSELIEEEKLVATVASMEEYGKQGDSYNEAVNKLAKQGINANIYSEFARSAYEMGVSQKNSYSDVETKAIELANKGLSASEIADLIVENNSDISREQATRTANMAKNKVFAESLSPEMTVQQRANAMRDRTTNENKAELDYLIDKYAMTTVAIEKLFSESGKIYNSRVVNPVVREIATSISKQFKDDVGANVMPVKLNNAILEAITIDGEVDAKSLTTALADIYGASIPISSNAYKTLTSSGENITDALVNYAVKGIVPSGVSNKASFKAIADSFKTIAESAVRQVSNARTKLFGSPTVNLAPATTSVAPEVNVEPEVNVASVETPIETSNVSEEKALTVSDDGDTMESAKETKTDIKKKFESIKKVLTEKYGEDVANELIKEGKDISSDISEYTKEITGKVVSTFKFVPHVLEAISSDSLVDARSTLKNGIYDVLSPFDIDETDFDSISDMAVSQVEDVLAELYGTNVTEPSMVETDLAEENNSEESEANVSEEDKNDIPEEIEGSVMDSLLNGPESVEYTAEGFDDGEADTSEKTESAEVDENTDSEAEVTPTEENTITVEAETAEDVSNKPYTVTKTKHTSTGEDIWVVSLSERLSKEEFANLRDEVKKVGGYYSNFAKTLDGKPLQGFIFKSEPGVNELMVFGEENIGDNNDVFEAGTTENIEQKSADDVNIEEKRNKENERSETGILDSEGEGYTGGSISEEVQSDEEGRNAGRSDELVSEDSTGKVSENARMVDGNENSTEGVQYTKSDTSGNLDSDGREHNDSEGRSDGTYVSSSRKLNTHNYKITEDIDSKRPNINDNLEAIKLLKSLEESGKKPTKEQQAILARYKGWGGLKQAFTDYYYIRELKEVLTDEEFATARSTVLNAHYTSTKVIDGIYRGLSRLGFKGGNILEPSMGTGNFFGVIPSGISGKSNLYGVEMDSITGRIAKMLYPDAYIEIAPFQDVKYPEGAFDAVVGNVPFSEVTFPYKGGKYTLHDYFFLKSLDSMKEGGVAMLLTSTGTLDKLNVKARHEIAKRANLVAAFRLPNDAFKTNAGASVTTDLIVLQKRGDTVPFNGVPFERIGKIGDIPINEYFVNNPQNILGELVREKGMYAQERTQVNPSGEDFDKIWSKAISRLPKDLLNGVTNDAPIDIATLNSNKSHFEEKDGKVIFYDSETGEVKNYSGKSAERVKEYLAVKDAYNNLLTSAKAGVNKAERDVLRNELSKVYDDFNKKFGFLQDKANNFLDDDIEFVKVAGLEILNPKTKKLEKSGIFTIDTIGYVKPVKADTSVDALAISINESGKVDFKRMSELVGKSKEEIAEDLEGSIIETPDGEYELISTYASGNIREKLRAVEGKEGFERNVEILKAAMPKDKTPSEIVPQLGASWISPKYIADFIKETHNLGPYAYVKVNYDKTSGTWTVERFYSNQHNMMQKFGTRRADAYEILVDTLNMKSTKVYDKYDDTRVLNTKETALARQKQAEVREAFSNWIFKDPDRRSALVKEYNELFNNHRNMDYSELANYLTFPGLKSTWKMRDYQKTAVARVVFGGNTLLAHGVGTGKTSEMIASAMEMKRMGITRKNIMVVPKHKVGDFRIDILKMYPEAKVLMATEKDFKKENRGKLFSKIGTNDWDIIVVGHSSFGLLPVSNETQAAYIEKEKADLEEVIERAREESGRNVDKRFISNLEKTLQRTESKLKDLLNAPKDDTITFEELGIDGLFVDEAHNFKNLPFYTKLNLPGIKGGASKRASDLFMKTEYLRNSGGRIVFATATPVTNTISELYNMTRFVSPEVLKDAGIYSFDSWASNFGNIETKVEMSPDGKNFRTKERFSKYFNVPEMIGMFRQFADILRTSDVVKELPKAKYIDVISPALDIHEGYIDSIVNRMKHMSSGGQTKNDNMLLVTSDGRAMATDLRLVASQLEGYDLAELDVESSRINKAVRNIVDEYKKSNEIKGTQFVFLDFGMNANEGGRYAYDLYGDIIEKLVNNGIPLKEIAKIGDYDTQAKKDDLFAKVNKGEIRVLIGSTAKMGEGMNAQERAVALHHLNAPYRPSDIEQREGRIIRYGNKNKDVNIYRYIQEKSFDSYMWQMLARKAEFINQAMSNGDISEIEETDEFVLSAKTGMAVASGNPLILKKVEIDEEVKRLQGLKKSYDASYYDMQERLMKLPSEIEGMENLMSRVSSDIETLKNNASEDFSIKLGKKVYDKRNDAAKALVPLVKNKYGASGSEIIGSYRGLNIKLSKTFTGSTLYLGSNAEMKIELSESAEGNITKIVNAAGRFDTYLEFLQKKQDTLKKELESVKADIDKPFKYQAQLDKALAEQSDIDSQLNFGEDNSDIVEDMNDEFEAEDDEFEHKYYIESEEKRNGIKGNLVDVRNRWRALFGTKERSETIFGEFGKIKQTSKEQRQRYSERIRRAGRYVRRIVDGFGGDYVFDSDFTQEMKDISSVNSKLGLKTYFVIGGITDVEDGVKSTGGITGNGNVFISYDAETSPWKISRHECCHWKYDEFSMQRIAGIIYGKMPQSLREKLFASERYKKYFNNPKATKASVFEEIVCDIMSGSLPDNITYPFGKIVYAFWHKDIEAVKNFDSSEFITKEQFKNGKRYSLDDDGIYDYGDEWRELLEEYGYIPKGENPARDVSVPKKIDKKHVVSRFARTMMEAGVTPDYVVSEFEERILDGTMTHIPITNDAARNWANKEITDKGFEDAMTEWNNLVDSDAVGKKQMVLGMELYNQCITNGDVANAMKIAADLTATATQAGQMLQACRVLKLMSPDGQLYYLEKSIDKINKEFKDKLGKKFSDIELNEQLIKEFLNEKDETRRNEIYDMICQDIADQLPSTWKERWDAWRYLAMLGNPRTHLKNVFGNAVFVPAIRMKNFVGAILEQVSKVDRNERTRSFYKTKEAKDFAKNDANDPDIKKALKGINAKYATTDDIESKRTIFDKKGMGWVEYLRRKNFDSLEAEDWLFLKSHYVDTLARVITARKIDVNNIEPETLDKLRAFAIRQAQEYTYRDANALAEALNKLQRSASTSKRKAIRVAGILMEGVMPFKKTPLNIAKQGLQYSPYSILTGISKSYDKLKRNGEISTSEIIDDFAKGTTGTGLMLIGYFLAQLGMLRGNDDEDEKRKRFDKLVGEQSYALKVGDNSYTIDWMTPSSLPLFVGLELYEALKGDGFQFKDIAESLTRLSDPLLELSVFSGISNTIDAAKYSGSNALYAIAGDMTMSYFSQALPTIFGQITRMLDGTKRNYYFTDKNSPIPAGLQRVIGQVSSKIPFASLLLEPSVDDWGREEKYGGVLERILENTVSPGYYSKASYTDVDEELDRLYSVTGENKVLPPRTNKYFTQDKVRYDLTSEEYTAFKKDRGSRSFMYVYNLIKSDDYNNYTDEEKVNQIEKCYDRAYKEAKMNYFGEPIPAVVDRWGRPEDYDELNQTQKAGYLTKTEFNHLETNLEGLQNRLGDKYDVYPPVVNDSFSRDGVKYELTQSEYEKFQKDIGKRRAEYAYDLIKYNYLNYNKMIDTEKDKALESAYERAREEVINDYLGEENSIVVDGWGREYGYFKLSDKDYAEEGYLDKNTYNVLDEEMNRLEKELKNTSANPTVQNSYYEENKVRYNMTPEEHAEAKRLRGKISAENAYKLITSESYKKLSPEKQRDKLDDIYSDAGKKVKAIMLPKIKRRISEEK